MFSADAQPSAIQSYQCPTGYTSWRETISSPSLPSDQKKKLLIQLMSLVNSPLSKNRIRSAYDTGCTQGQDKHLQITFHAEHALGVAYGFLKTTFCLIVSVWNSQLKLKHTGGEKKLTNGSSLSSWAQIKLCQRWIKCTVIIYHHLEETNIQMQFIARIINQNNGYV